MDKKDTDKGVEFGSVPEASSSLETKHKESPKRAGGEPKSKHDASEQKDTTTKRGNTQASSGASDKKQSNSDEGDLSKSQFAQADLSGESNLEIGGASLFGKRRPPAKEVKASSAPTDDNKVSEVELPNQKGVELKIDQDTDAQESKPEPSNDKPSIQSLRFAQEQTKLLLKSLQDDAMKLSGFQSGLVLTAEIEKPTLEVPDDEKEASDGRKAANDGTWPRIKSTLLNELSPSERLKLGMLFSSGKDSDELRASSLLDNCLNLSEEGPQPSAIREAVQSDSPLSFCSGDVTNTFDFKTTSNAADVSTVAIQVQPWASERSDTESNDVATDHLVTQLTGLVQSLADNKASKIDIDAEASSPQYLMAFMTAIKNVQAKTPNFIPDGNWQEACMSALSNESAPSKTTTVEDVPAPNMDLTKPGYEESKANSPYEEVDVLPTRGGPGR